MLPSAFIASLFASACLALPSTTDSQLPSTCFHFYQVQPGDNCNVLLQNFPNTFTLTQLYLWNSPYGLIDRHCNLGYPSRICIGATDYTFTPPAQSAPGTIEPESLVPVPTIGSAVASCASWYLVGSGTLIGEVVSKAGVNVQDFLTWNGLSNATDPLWADYWYCVG